MPGRRFDKFANRISSMQDAGIEQFRRFPADPAILHPTLKRSPSVLTAFQDESASSAPDHNRFDIAIECLLAVLICFSTFSFGATQRWSQEVALALSWGVLFTLSVKLAVQRDATFIWTWTYIPLGLFIVLVAIQLLNLPSPWVSAISPQAISLRSHLLGTPIPATTLSLYPLETRLQLQLPLCAGSIFIVVLNVYRRREQILRLLVTIAVVGAGVILLAVYQNLSGSRLIYGIVPAIQRNSGPFMNYGHFSQFTNLSIGAALGLMLYQFERNARRFRTSFAKISEFLRSGQNWALWLLVGEIVVGAATIFLSMSRMGAMSMISAGAITAMIICLRSHAPGPGAIFVVLAILIFAVLLYAGFDSIFDRLATLRHINVAAGGRWEILRDLRPAWARFPLIGTGLGTHEFVFPMFDRSTITQLAAYAENEYAQVLEEVGVLGLATVLAFLSIVLWNLAPVVWNPLHRVDAVAYGLLYSIIAVSVHSFSDFGQHVPAIAFVTACECALILALNRLDGRGNHSKVPQPNNPTSPAGWLILPRWAVVITVMATGVSLLSQADRARAAQAKEDVVLAAEDPGSHALLGSTLAEKLALLDCARQAVALEPENVSYQLDSADHSWELIAATSEMHGQNQLALNADAVQKVRELVRSLRDARLSCPTFGPLYTFSGQMEKYILQDPRGNDDIRKGAELTSYDANVCFIAGELDASENHWDLALGRMHRAVDLSESFRSRVIDALTLQNGRPDLAMPFATGHREALIHLADLLSQDDRHRDMRAALRAQAQALLLAECQTPGAPPESLMELGTEYQRQQRDADAVELYRRALTQDYGQVDWRLKLADALAKTHRNQEAIHQARICLQLHPALKAAEDLIADLSGRADGPIDH